MSVNPTTTSKNLGLVKALHVGETAPSNIHMIWGDISTPPIIHKFYNTLTEAWEPLGGTSSSSDLQSVTENGYKTNIGLEVTNNSETKKVNIGETYLQILIDIVSNYGGRILAHNSIDGFRQWILPNKAGTFAMLDDVFSYPSTVITANYSATIDDYEIICDTTSSNIVVTLPAITTGKIFCIKMADNAPAGRRVTIFVDAGGLINSSPSFILRVKSESIIVKNQSSGVYNIQSRNCQIIGTPSIAIGVGAGDAGGITDLIINGSDRGGVVQFRTTTPSALTSVETLFTITLTTSYTLNNGTLLAAVFVPANPASFSPSMANNVYIFGSGVNSLQVEIANPSLLSPSTLYTWRYIVQTDQF